MAEFIDFPLQTDPDILTESAIEQIQVYFPNFDPAETSLSRRQISALCQIIAEGRDVAAAPIPSAIFRWAGPNLFGVPATDPTRATVDSTWVARDNAGYGPVPAGTMVSIEGQMFETVYTITFPSLTTTLNPVALIAQDEGSQASNLGGADYVAKLEEAYDFVASITLNTQTFGGIDGEDAADYQTKLASVLQLMSPVAIVGADLAKLAKTVPGVDRVMVFDNYDYDTSTPNVAGVATVCPIDELGEALPSFTKGVVVALLTANGKRLMNGVVYVIDPTYHTIDVTGTVTAYPNQDLVATKAAADGAVADLLLPANWGQPPSGEERLWFRKPDVRRFDIAGALDRVEAVDTGSVTGIQINGVAADYAMTGLAALPRPGDIDITVVAAS